jgi:hypothetical protein
MRKPDPGKDNNGLPSRCTSNDRHSSTNAPTSDPGLHEFDLASRILRSCTQLLANLFSCGFELNPLLLTAAQLLLSVSCQTSYCYRVLDLGARVDSKLFVLFLSCLLETSNSAGDYFNIIASILGAAIS